jgi:hypothetical protein
MPGTLTSSASSSTARPAVDPVPYPAVPAPPYAPFLGTSQRHQFAPHGIRQVDKLTRTLHGPSVLMSLAEHRPWLMSPRPCTATSMPSSTSAMHLLTSCGGRGIRTHGDAERLTGFKAGACTEPELP